MDKRSKGFYPFTLLPFILLSFYPSVFASFEDLGAGARAAALGGAFTPVANDIDALYYNPAGLVYLKRKEFSVSYGLLHTGLVDKSRIINSYVAYGHPLKRDLGIFGFSWHQLSSDDLYSERVITFGYGKRVSQRWAAGINIKQLFRQFSAPIGATDNFGFTDPAKSDPVFAGGNSKSNIAVDFGFLFRPYRNYSYGLALQNLNEPNMAISDHAKDKVSPGIRMGMAYNDRNLTLIGELDSKKSPTGLSRDYHATFAAEKWWVGGIGSGFRRADLAARGSLAFGSRSFSQMTMGLSYRLETAQIDYGFLMPLGGLSFSSSQGHHRMTFTLRFGKNIVEPDYEVRMRSAELAAKKAEEELELARKEAERLAEELEKIKKESEKRKLEVDQTRHRSGKEAVVKQTASRLADTMDRYWSRKSAGATVNERIAVLTQILKEFSGTGLDLSMAERELSIAKSDRAKAEVDLAVSWSYYQKIVARGANIPERIQLLSQMIERFARTGADLNNIRDELKSLKEGIKD